jgi:2-amino-4-hydroxy-6-hydroxymethyldihydropteridine diphosphokinase
MMAPGDIRILAGFMDKWDEAKREDSKQDVVRVGVALGSNLGDRLENLRAARRAVTTIAGVELPVLASPIYETDPVGCEPGAAKFLNAVIEFSYAGELGELFDQLKRIEIELGRPANHQLNVSRAIDIDLLYFGDTMLRTSRLTLPHPRIVGRQFVLQPLANIRPDLVLPGQMKTVRELLASATELGKVVRLDTDWDRL